MTRPTETKPATVPLAQQAGDVPSRWRWVKPWVWTLRMLTILEQGIEGGKWFRLFDKVFPSARQLVRDKRKNAQDRKGCFGLIPF
jgi:hypothetical protein